MLGAFRCEENPSSFIQGLLPLRFRDAVGNDSRTDVEVRFVALDDQGPDRNRELAFAIKPKPADRAGVESARNSLEFGDNLPGALFWSPSDAAPGKTRAERIDLRNIWPQSARDGRDEMEDLLVPLEFQQLCRI